MDWILDHIIWLISFIAVAMLALLSKLWPKKNKTKPPPSSEQSQQISDITVKQARDVSFQNTVTTEHHHYHHPSDQRKPKGSRILFERNEQFVGREQDLQTLVELFKSNAPVAIVSKQTQTEPANSTGTIKASITGIGGIGKTQLASAFVHRFGERFPAGVYWLSFADAEQVDREIMACGLAMDVAVDDTPLPEAVRLTRLAWEDGQERLLVFDNCESEDLLAEYVPKTGKSRVLLTSRRQQWSPSLNVTTHFLDSLPRTDSIALLIELCPRLQADDPSMDKIADELGDLPLALHLAGSFLAVYEDWSPKKYLQRIEPSLEGHGVDHSPTGHELHVDNTFALSFDQLDTQVQVDKIALALLSRAACLMPGESFPQSLLLLTLNEDTDDLLAADGCRRLINLGILESPISGHLRLHRLVWNQVSKRLKLNKKVVEFALNQEANRLNEEGYPKAFEAWVMHFKWVCDHAEEREAKGALCCNMGFYLQSMGDLVGALPYFEQSLTSRYLIYGEDHPNTAQSMNNLGYLHQNMGNLDLAFEYLKKALDIRFRIFGEDHITAISLNNLGGLLVTKGDNKSALLLFKNALVICRKIFPEPHQDIAMCLNNIGDLLGKFGDFSGALLYLEQALAMNQQVLGEEHPRTAINLENIGKLLESKGDPKSARPYFEQALTILGKSLGPSHPYTCAARENLDTCK